MSKLKKSGAFGSFTLFPYGKSADLKVNQRGMPDNCRRVGQFLPSKSLASLCRAVHRHRGASARGRKLFLYDPRASGDKTSHGFSEYETRGVQRSAMHITTAQKRGFSKRTKGRFAIFSRECKRNDYSYKKSNENNKKKVFFLMRSI